MSETYAPHEFQYASARHQAETAISGMWLFLATEMLFFGGLLLSWIYLAPLEPGGLRRRRPAKPSFGSARSTPPS